MFFLVRCAFWLGLVFLNMDWKIDEPVLPSASDLVGQATQQCLANPQACSKLVTTAQQVYTASVTPSASPAPAQPSRPAAKVQPVKSSADSLRADDRAPTWRGSH